MTPNRVVVVPNAQVAELNEGLNILPREDDTDIEE